MWVSTQRVGGTHIWLRILMCLRKHQSCHCSVIGTDDGWPDSPRSCHSQETNLGTSAAWPFPLNRKHPASGLAVFWADTQQCVGCVFFPQEDRDSPGPRQPGQGHGGQNGLREGRILWASTSVYFTALCLNEQVICTKPQCSRDVLMGNVAEAILFLGFPCALHSEAAGRMPASPTVASGLQTLASIAPKVPVFLQGQNQASFPSVTPALRLAHSRCSKKILLGFTWNKFTFESKW